MPMNDHRKSVNRLLDNIFEPKSVWSKNQTDYNILNTGRSSSTSTSISDSQSFFSKNFNEDFKQRKVNFFPNIDNDDRSDLSSCLQIKHEGRLDAGSGLCERKIAKRLLCKKKKPYSQPNTKCKANMVYIPPPDKIGGVAIRCGIENKDKTKGTQTLYRESSAQTLPYLPPVCNIDEALLEDYEIFKLPSILPGDGPPGLYEVEVLERARKRWAFAKALRTKLKNQMKEVRSELKKSEHRMILEAFEWEHWIEREEYIQEIQMMRLELVIRMFNHREKEMHSKSQISLELRCQQIKATRDARLKKNEVEYSRAMRRLEKKHSKKPRVWRKEEVIKELGDPSSEFYGPQMRYGVNPNRRHYPISRKEFEKRIDILDTKVAKMKSLECPFEKINKWAKPKERIKELEKNFCSEKNLKNLYDSLKGLRKQSQLQKEAPKCLVEKPPKEVPRSESTLSWRGTSSYMDGMGEEGDESDGRMYVPTEMICKDRKAKRLAYLEERRAQEIEVLLARYEGSSIGWLMRFLANEEKNLVIQRKAHYISSIAQRERCRREALAALLEKKENLLREKMDYIYEKTKGAQEAVGDQYLSEIMDIDTKLKADCDAQEAVTALAKQVDLDIKRWLVPRPCVEGTFNYESLRHLLKDLIFPCPNTILEKREKEYIGRVTIEDLLNGVLEQLEPFDIGTVVADEIVNRSFDNDLYYFSSECSCCSESDVSDCDSARREAMAIIRKVIRQSVPGRRWKEPTERLVHTNVEDLIDDAFDEVHRKWDEDGRPEESDSPLSVRSQDSYYNLAEQKNFKDLLGSSSSSGSSRLDHVEELSKVKFTPGSETTKPSETMDGHILLHTAQYRVEPEETAELHHIAETINILEKECFTDIQIHHSKGEDSSFSSAVITTICFDYKDKPADDCGPLDSAKTTVPCQSCDDGPGTDEVVEIILDIVFKCLEASGPCPGTEPKTPPGSIETSSTTVAEESDDKSSSADESSSMEFSGYGSSSSKESVHEFPPATKSEPIEGAADHDYLPRLVPTTSCMLDVEGQLSICDFAAPLPKPESATSSAEADSNSSSQSLKIQWICPRRRSSKH